MRSITILLSIAALSACSNLPAPDRQLRMCEFDGGAAALVGGVEAAGRCCIVSQVGDALPASVEARFVGRFCTVTRGR